MEQNVGKNNWQKKSAPNLEYVSGHLEIVFRNWNIDKNLGKPSKKRVFIKTFIYLDPLNKGIKNKEILVNFLVPLPLK